MIDRGHELPLSRQASLLKLSRSSLYYKGRPVVPANLTIMRRIDELHLALPFAGCRMLRALLRGEGVTIGRDRVAGMMRRMRIAALYRRPNTSKPNSEIYPYLLPRRRWSGMVSGTSSIRIRAVSSPPRRAGSGMNFDAL